MLQQNDFRQEICNQVKDYDNNRRGDWRGFEAERQEERKGSLQNDQDAAERSALLMVERIQAINEQKRIEKIRRKRRKEIKSRQRQESGVA
mmetsp:Transcript_39876/g.125270  ORF Transcript_39876/g.125270 Transcript_39876/m.125270 type:complete len:91 (-) Transcript_39876:51-323(-)